MTKPSPILILGMHRSGTSCLAGSLEIAGLYLGNVNTQAGFNKKGNRENNAAMKLHEAILNRVDAAWNMPPLDEPKWTNAEIANLETLLKEFQDNDPWGLKDPRILFILDGWMQLTKPRFIGTFRHPEQVAASLMNRAQHWQQAMNLETALNLWAVYNQRMLALHTVENFDIIRYDIEPNLYHKKLIKAGHKFGIDVPDTPRFRETALHNQKGSAVNISKKHHSIWEALNDIAI